jgi:hypothetical protein
MGAGGKRGKSSGKGDGLPGGPAGTRGEGQADQGGNATVAWWVAGALLVVVLIALGYPVLTRGSGPAGGAGGSTTPPGMGGAPGNASGVDLTTMTLEEQGTILFNRVMSSSSSGDTADVEFFLPKALVIYEQLDPSDPDGLYHYALLHMVGEDFEAALEKVAEGLAQVPDYVLLLGVGAEAAAANGETATARELYTHLLDVYEAELRESRVGYDHHQPMFPAYRSAAERFLGRG